MFSLLLLTMIAWAEDPEPEPKIVYKQKTEIDFEGIELEGEIIKPQGALVLDRQTAAFNPLIKLRTDFDKEMELSVQEIK